jgi:hypothetical protein
MHKISAQEKQASMPRPQPHLETQQPSTAAKAGKKTTDKFKNLLRASSSVSKNLNAKTR